MHTKSLSENKKELDLSQNFALRQVFIFQDFWGILSLKHVYNFESVFKYWFFGTLYPLYDLIQGGKFPSEELFLRFFDTKTPMLCNRSYHKKIPFLKFSKVLFRFPKLRETL
jgi:hypothetical protein